MSGPTTTPNGQIVPKQQAREPRPEDQLIRLVSKMGPELARALPKHVTAERMSRIVLTAIRTTPDLAYCSQASFLGCVLSCAQLGLEPNTPLGHAYLIPRKLKGKLQCTMIIGYRGMVDLAYRSGFLQSLNADAVKEGDEFEYEAGLNPVLRHRHSPAADREKKKTSHVWVVFDLKGGAKVWGVLSRAQVEARRERSSAASSSYSPWTTDYDAMAMKTAIRAKSKWVPQSSEVARIIAIDEAPELGRSQLEMSDPEVIGLLQSHGLDTDGEMLPDDAKDEMDADDGDRSAS